MVQRGVSPAAPRAVASRFWSLPNLLTYGRIIAIPALVACFFVKGDWGRWAAMWIFIAAGVSDFLDGYLARAWKQQSAIGRMLDPIADKLIVSAALLMLAADQTIAGWSLWAGVIILCREILVSGLREFASPNGRPWCRWWRSAFCSRGAQATRSGPTPHCSA
jgi:CDP-diacylglycerol--glycerol-3-phosphate 3-phosphatidyltransferase